MRIVATSDTHALKFDDLPKRLIEYMDNSDLVIHAGDFTSAEIFDNFSERYELKAVYGDSDEEEIMGRLKEVEVFEIEDVKIGIVHKGNYLNSFDDLGYKAKELGVNLLIFGHIHRFVLDKFGSVLVLCPGSPTKPRQSIASFAVIEIGDGKVKINFEIADKIFCGIKLR